jgi:hypothetical protein
MTRKVAFLTALAMLLTVGTAAAKPNWFYDVSSQSATYTTGFGCTGGVLGKKTFGTDAPNWIAGTAAIKLSGARPNTTYDTFISSDPTTTLPCTNLSLQAPSLTTNSKGNASATFSFTPLTVSSYVIFLLVAETNPGSDRGTLTSASVPSP